MSMPENATVENSIAEVLSGLNKVLEERKYRLAEITSRIEDLEFERQEVVNALPHTDDIVGVFVRGVDGQRREFEQQFSAHLNAVYTVAGSAAAVSPQNAPNILTIEGRKPSEQESRDRVMRKETPPLNMAALVYLLGDRIKEELPALVARLCPAAAGGMKGSERAALLTKIDSELAIRRDQRAALSAELNEAVKTVREATGR